MNTKELALEIIRRFNSETGHFNPDEVEALIATEIAEVVREHLDKQRMSMTEIARLDFELDKAKIEPRSVWASKKPDRAGWWWFRESASRPKMPCEVLLHNGTMCMRVHLLGSWWFLQNIDGQWSSEPIPEPVEAETVQTKG